MEIIVPTLQDKLLAGIETTTVPFGDRVIQYIWSTDGDSVIGESDPVLDKPGVRVFVSRGRVLVSSYTLQPGSINRMMNDPIELLVTNTEQLPDEKLRELVEFLLTYAEKIREVAPVRQSTETNLTGLI